ncbi:DNA recombination protein RmuC [Cesiribacter sp. SM1]|uniref:DNA recombination protein RmuC n=1 Tax=Cesiribacter sp. SM1 TaxID=2861196 RepID=UPI001CD70A0C|nr:DNA recombination protein RmuC [Cesiribacter sp. SM1]
MTGLPLLLLLFSAGSSLLLLFGCLHLFKKGKEAALKHTEAEHASQLAQDRYLRLQEQHNRLLQEREQLQFSEADLRSSLVEAQTTNRHLQEKLGSQKEELRQLQEQLRQQFENLAHQVLSQQREQLAESNSERLRLILDPLKERIASFEQRVEKNQENQTVQSEVLKGELERLARLNQQMSEEARNLTQALKGDNKIQGNWGELVLERILESSGLQRGSEYLLQGEDMGLRGEDGQAQRPDVIVRLPEGRHLIIDAKVSLKAYESFCNCPDETERLNYLKQHIHSLRSHVKGLSEKHYYRLHKLNTPDFVLLFVPIEASFSLALSTDTDSLGGSSLGSSSLFQYAWERKVIIVSPTTLLATLRTTASIWKYEKQNQNALQIAEESGRLYDKFYGFVQELEKIGALLDKSQETYSEAMKKLSTGKGNLLSRAEKLKSMGINAKKDMGELGLLAETAVADE